MAQPISLKANSMKDAVVGPEVVMNIHTHMYMLNVSLELNLTSFKHRRLCHFIRRDKKLMIPDKNGFNAN